MLEHKLSGSSHGLEVDIGKNDASTLSGELEGGLETNAAVVSRAKVTKDGKRATVRAGACNMTPLIIYLSMQATNACYASNYAHNKSRATDDVVGETR